MSSGAAARIARQLAVTGALRWSGLDERLRVRGGLRASIYWTAVGCDRHPEGAHSKAMSALESLLEQALQLPDAERGKLAMQLLRTLEPDDEDEVTGTSGKLPGRPKSIAV